MLTKVIHGSATNQVAGLMSAEDKQLLTTISNNYVSTSALGSLMGANSGVATLDASGKIPSSQLPSYVDDVIEAAQISAFPATGESGKIYVALDTNKTYRWSGSAYVEISESLALGETSSTAYRGDRGKSAYDHAVAKGSAFASGLYKITTNAEGHVTAATAVVKADITGLGIPAQDTTYQSLAAAENGPDISLVSTGEKYIWNSKADGNHTHNYAGSNSVGGAANQVNVTTFNATTQGQINYIAFLSQISGAINVISEKYLYLWHGVENSTLTTVYLNVGKDNIKGGITLRDTSKKHGDILTDALTADRYYTLPDATGTIALTSSDITGTAAKTNAANLTTTTNALAYYSNTTGTFANAQYVTYLGHEAANAGTNNTGYIDGLLIIGQGYGNTAADLISNTVGVLSYGDAGPQIRFRSTTATSYQSGALIFTHQDSAGLMASWHFVTPETDGANVTAAGFTAKSYLTVGQNLINTSYNLYVTGTSHFSNTAIFEGNNANAPIIVRNGGGQYNQGIRIMSRDKWSDIILCGEDATEASGTSANTWSILNNNGNFYITRNGATTGDAILACVNNIWTLNDRLIIEASGSTTDNNPAALVFYNTDTTINRTQTGAYIAAYNTHANNNNGMNMVIQSAAGMFIGGGESPNALYALYKTSTTENMWITADNVIWIYSNANSIANRIGFAIATNGSILPYKAEVANSNMQDIGSSDNVWANVYATTIHGALDGNAATATADADGNVISSSYLKLSGGTITGTLVLSQTQDAKGTQNVSPALIVGGTATTPHIQMDCNEILAKENGTTPTALSLNTDGGIVQLGAQTATETDYIFIRPTTEASNTTTGALRVSGGVGIAKQLYVGSTSQFNNTMEIFPAQNSFREGIRIHAHTNDWCDLVFCGSDNTASSGTSTGTWSILNHTGAFYIARNGNGATTGDAILSCVNNVWSWNGTATGNISGNAGTVSHTLATTTKYYISGTTLTTTGNSAGTFDTGIYSTTTAGQLNATTYLVDEKVCLEYNSTDQSLDFVFV